MEVRKMMDGSKGVKMEKNPFPLCFLEKEERVKEGREWIEHYRVKIIC
jgi:hypothetical protein